MAPPESGQGPGTIKPPGPWSSKATLHDAPEKTLFRILKGECLRLDSDEGEGRVPPFVIL